MTEEQLFETPHQSSQLPLWELGDSEWRNVLRLPAYAPRERRADRQAQVTLFPLDAVG